MSETTTLPAGETPGPTPAEPGPDLLERLSEWWANYLNRHPRVQNALGLLIRIWLVLAIPIVVLALIIVPKLGNMVGVVAGVAWFLLQMLIFVRSRTLALGTVLRFYSLGVTFALPIGLFSVWLRCLLGMESYTDEASVYLAGPVEEVGKLLPLLVFGLVGWNRMRRMSVGDFVIAGAAAGAGFQLVEDSIRQIATEPGLLSMLAPNEGGPNYGITLFPGWLSDGEHEFAGHGAFTAIAAGGIGLAVMLRKLRVWRWLIPGFLLGWMILSHAGYNSGVALDTHLPDPLVSVYEFLGSGYRDRALLFILIIVAPVVDFWAMRTVAGRVPALSKALPTPPPLPGEPPRPPGRASQFAQEWRTYAAALSKGAGTLLFALPLVREQRELAIGEYRSRHRVWRRRALEERVLDRSGSLAAMLSGAALAVTLLTIFAIKVPGTATTDEAFLAGLFDALLDWWNGMSTWEQVLTVLGVLTLFSGGGLAILARIFGTALIRRFGYRIPQYYARYLFENWHKATFNNRMQSILYHLRRHGRGRSVIEYTRDAMNFFRKYRQRGQPVVLRDGTPGIKIRIRINGRNVGGYWTRDGKLVTFWD